MTHCLSLAMQRCSIEQEQENMLNDMDFYLLQENIKSNYWMQD